MSSCQLGTVCCFQAHKVGLFGSRIVWMFVGWYSSEFWRTNLDDVSCTVEEMEEAADGAFVLGFYYRNPVIERGIAGLTGNTVDFFYADTLYNNKIRYNDNLTGTNLRSRGDSVSQITQEHCI